MATHPIERVLHPKNSLDSAKDNFEKNFYTSIRKAINNVECPVKEKHVRRILIGTFQTKSGLVFWRYARSLPLEEHPIICWKFCHVLHKVLRDGHPRVIQDSHRFKSRLLDLGKMWGLLKQGYGKLIQNYCSLLVNKMDFHYRNQRIPGNLIISNSDLDSIGENDVNVFFQLCCEIFDYMDEILCLQNYIFSSLDMSRSNSMTSSGQCRLAPLIMCIQDSSQLYDFTVKILFKLHSSLPPSTLEGHRDRFLNQFKLLKQFYYNSKNLQYFRTLIQIPTLPDDPPNFFIQSSLSNHVTPVVIVPQQEEIDTDSNLLDLTFNDNDSDKGDAVSMWSFQEESKPEIHEQSIIMEKDRIIEKLMGRIEELEIDIRRTKLDDERKIDELKRSIAELECATAQRMEREIEGLKQELEKQKVSQVSNETEGQVAIVTEKFTKMKDFYNKLRSEHIELIRTKAECDRHLTAAKATIEELQTSKETLESQLKDNTRREVEMSVMSTQKAEMLEQMSTFREQCKTLTQKLENVETERKLIADKLNKAEQQIEALKREMAKMTEDSKANLTQGFKQFITQFIAKSVDASKKIIDQDLELGFASVNCTPQYFCSQIDILISKLGAFETAILKTEYSLPLFLVAFDFYYQLFYTMNCSKTTIQSLPNIELSDELLAKCVQFISSNFELSTSIDRDFSNAASAVEKVKESLKAMQQVSLSTIPEFVSNKNSDLETLLKTEMEQMDRAILEAEKKIEQMMAAAKKDTGVKLEVNGKILDACTSLMQAIKQLIQDSKQLQLEIAAKERGSSSMKEFYQRNHRWTEGLISAAKTVAADANLLVETADKLIRGNGKFEELMAASQEIAAACAQLVVASRVKASSSSENLARLSKSSKAVLTATGNVIATTKHCNKLIEESDVTDFSKLTLHQAKRLEMECQVKVLELENLLEKERLKLASVRRTHYHLADSLGTSIKKEEE
ncbi:histidine permease [Tyrophagus putrescentiae]|nr:histidine permease [Tyrophagus putrescentiae]